MTRRLVVEADGGSRGNPGPAGYGALVADAQTGEVLAELHDSLGTTTNNVAEYSGLVAALRAAADLEPGADVEVRMDSRLVVEQMSGRWRIKDPGLRELATAAGQAADRLGHVTFTWVPRSSNKRADALANQAMDAARGDGNGQSSRTGREDAVGQPGGDRGAGGGRRRQPSVVAASPETAEPTTSSEAGRGWGQARGRGTTTLLLRHGATPLSAERRFAGRGDIPLTDDGRRQAAAAAARLSERGGLDVIVTSPLRRARRTAEAVAQASGAPLVVDDDLVEADFGAWEGLSFAEASAKSPDEMKAWLASADAAPPGGESFTDVARRVLRALDRLLDAYPERTLVLVSHVTPIKTLLCRALLAPPAALFRIHLDVASLSQVDWFADGPALVRSMNDTAHLR
ncbi:MAG TPA: bifunctional RNase H/acid phosphatase [Streptosporangiaceae bacterium]|nr:bifunctional RNase H/acid phosphatase [Streptosporangiaceae bacterium]